MSCLRPQAALSGFGRPKQIFFKAALFGVLLKVRYAIIGDFSLGKVLTNHNIFSVTAKIRSLYDCQLRLMHNIQPLPSGIDIANTVKYFSQTLLSKYYR